MHIGLGTYLCCFLLILFGLTRVVAAPEMASPPRLVAGVWRSAGPRFCVCLLSGLLYVVLQEQQEWKLPAHILLVKGTHKARPGSEGGEMDSICWWVGWQEIYGHFQCTIDSFCWTHSTEKRSLIICVDLWELNEIWYVMPST